MKRRSGEKRITRAQALMSAALLLPGLQIDSSHAQSAPSAPEIRLGYMEYRDWQKGEDRMRVHTPQLWGRTPLSEKSEIEGSFTYDSMSGASPYFLSTLSGASGAGVDDDRVAGDLKYTSFFDGFSLGIGTAMSNENDYRSRTMSLESRIWTPNKNTTFAIGGSFTDDHLSSMIDARVDEGRSTGGALIGVTQVLDEVSLIQTNLSYSSGDGYFSDPYKPLDNRPRSREEWAWLTQYRHFFKESEGTLALEYRYFHDTWNVGAHTVSVAWNQPVGESWIVRPSVRYYTQRGAYFFSPNIQDEGIHEKFFSGDQRLSDFGSVTVGFRVEHELVKNFSVAWSLDYMHQRQGLALTGHDAADIEPLNAAFGMFEIIKRFSE